MLFLHLLRCWSGFYPSPFILLMWCFVLMICECWTIPASYNKSCLIMLCVCVCAQSCLTLCNPMDCSLPGSSIRGILQAGILEWVAISSSTEPSQPRDWTRVSHIIRQILYHQCPLVVFGLLIFCWEFSHLCLSVTLAYNFQFLCYLCVC